jgi:hypothetical protein
MSCKVCGFTNPPGALACQACGTTLEAVTEPAARAGDAVCATHKERPALAPCERCGTFYCAQCLQRAADGKLYCETCRSRATALPWDQRGELGMMRAWWQTSVLLLKAPQATLQSAPRDAPLASSILFTLISTIAGFGLTFAAYVVLIAGAFVVGANESQKMGGDAAMGTAGSVLMGLFVVLFYGVLIFAGQLIAVLVIGGIEHLMLKMLGERELGPYTVTVRAHSLGLAPYVLGLFPFCGVMVMGMWSLVIRCMSLATLQRVNTGKAVIAVLSPLAVMCIGCGGFYGLIVMAVLGSAGLSG